MVHYEFLPQGHTVNKEYYIDIMRRLRDAIHQKLTELWENQDVYDDKTPAHTSMFGREHKYIISERGYLEGDKIVIAK